MRAFLRDNHLDAYADALIADGFDIMRRLLYLREEDLDDFEVGSYSAVLRVCHCCCVTLDPWLCVQMTKTQQRDLLRKLDHVRSESRVA